MSLKSDIKNMRKLAKRLIPYTAPMVSIEEEYKVLPLKKRIINIDGYEATVSLSAGDYKDYVMWAVQIEALNFPFLPFNMVCKIGRIFLGNTHLSYLDFVKNNRKIYCWILRRKDGERISVEGESNLVSYEGFEYVKLDSGSVELY